MGGVWMQQSCAAGLVYCLPDICDICGILKLLKDVVLQRQSLRLATPPYSRGNLFRLEWIAANVDAGTDAVAEQLGLTIRKHRGSFQ